MIVKMMLVARFHTLHTGHVPVTVCVAPPTNPQLLMLDISSDVQYTFVFLDVMVWEKILRHDIHLKQDAT